MWSDNYYPLSQIHTRDNHVAELAWRDGKLYFALRDADNFQVLYDDLAVEVAIVENAPQLETRLLESASADSLYILSGHRTFFSRTRGQSWEEF